MNARTFFVANRTRQAGAISVFGAFALCCFFGAQAFAQFDTNHLASTIVQAQDLYDATDEGDRPTEAPTAVKQALQSAIAAAQAVCNNPPDQETVDMEVVHLLDAMNDFNAGITPIPENRADLKNLIDAAQDLHDEAIEGTDPYNVAPGSKATLQTAIDVETLVYDEIKSDELEIGASITNLTGALDIFEQGRQPEADKTNLIKFLDIAGTLLNEASEGTNAWQYTLGASNTFEGARAAAETVRSNKYAFQTEVNDAVPVLQAAMAVFEKDTTVWLCEVEYNMPPPVPLNYVLKNSGPADLIFQCQIAGPGGLSVAPEDGTISPASEQTLVASVDHTGKSIGAYVYTNTIAFAGGDRPPRELRVILIVHKTSQIITFPQIPDQEPDTTVELSAEASSGLPVHFTVLGGPAILQDGTNLLLTGEGDVSVRAEQDGDNNWNAAPPVTREFAVKYPPVPPPPEATIIFSDLNHVYSGTPRPVVVSTVPTGLVVRVTYDGNVAPPVHAGTYTVLAIVEDDVYVGESQAQLIVNKAVQTMATPIIADPQEVTNRVLLRATASSGLPVDVSVQQGPGRIEPGPYLVFSATGHVVVAYNQAGNRDWNPTSSVASVEIISSSAVRADELEVGFFKGRSLVFDLTGSSEAGYPLTYRILRQPARGILDGHAPRLAYTPSASFVGSDFFTFDVHDGYRYSEPATVTIRVRPLPPNDFVGQGASSVGVYDVALGEWTIRSFDGRLVAWAMPWGGPGCLPVSGDFDGDGVADIMVYWPGIGAWFGLSLDSRVLAWNFLWGGLGLMPVSGDFDGDGCDDLMVYSEDTGMWYGWSLARNQVITWGQAWGGFGFQTVSGDFDGDMYADFAVMDKATASWYIMGHNGDVLAWNKKVAPPDGAPGDHLFVGVSGDLDGDLSADLITYDYMTGRWYALGVSGEPLVLGLPWGGPGFLPASGDFDGDGNYDIAVYEPIGSKWYIYSIDGRILAWDMQWGWGGQSVIPVGP